MLKHKGEFEVELGLGLPRMTTAQREAYTPPDVGYQVYDIDLKEVATFQDSVWTFLDKIDITDGIAKNSLTLNAIDDSEYLKLSGDGTTTNIISGSTIGIMSVGTTANKLNIADTVITAATPIIGVSSTDPASLITLQNVIDVAGGYTQSFSTNDWVGQTLIIPVAAHALSFVSGDAYAIEVQELKNNVYRDVSIERGTDATSGDVILTTAGQPFAGRISISK